MSDAQKRHIDVILRRDEFEAFAEDLGLDVTRQNHLSGYAGKETNSFWQEWKTQVTRDCVAMRLRPTIMVSLKGTSKAIDTAPRFPNGGFVGGPVRSGEASIMPQHGEYVGVLGGYRPSPGPKPKPPTTGSGVKPPAPAQPKAADTRDWFVPEPPPGNPLRHDTSVDPRRQAFERVHASAGHRKRLPDGRYLDPYTEAHWQMFKGAWDSLSALEDNEG